MKKYLLLIVLFLVGCTSTKFTPLSNDEIITEVRKIEKSGLRANCLLNCYGEVVKIIAMPKKEVK